MRSIEEIKEIKKELTESVFGECFTNYDTLSSYYDQTVNVGKTPKDVEIYRPPSARAHVNAAVNHVMSLGQNVIVPLWSETEESKKMASRLTKFGSAFLQLLDRKYKNTRRNCIKNGILYGTFILKGALYTPRLQSEDISDKEWDKYLASSFPFFYRSCHPRNVVWVDGDCVIEMFDRKVIQVKQNWDEWKTDKKLFDDVKWWEYWTDTERVYFADDEVVLEEENPYKFIPYEIGYGGFGIESPAGKPEDLIVSMIAPNLSAYKMEYRTGSALFSGLEYSMWSRPIANRNLEEHEKLANTPGELSVVGDDAGLKHFGVEQISPDAYRMMDILNRDMEKVTPSVLQGRGTAYESGYGQASRMDYARVSLLTSLIADWESAAGNVLDKTIALVKNVVEEPVGILGDFSNEKAMISIDPNEINPSLHHFLVRLDAKTPEQKEHRWRLGMDSWVTGSISLETLHTDFYGIDHLTESERMLIEKALNHPAVLQVITQEALKDAGMRDLLALIQKGQLNTPETQRKPLEGLNQQNENMRAEASVGSMTNQMKAEEFK